MKTWFAIVSAYCLAASGRASIVVDDFSTGSYNFDTSPYVTYYNGATHSRFYFQAGTSILGTNRMILVASNPNFPTNDQFDGSIGGGEAFGQNTPGNDLYWEYDYGVSQASGPFPWQPADLNADLLGNDVVRFFFSSTSGNVSINVNFDSAAAGYHDSGEFVLPNSATPFTYDVPLSIWSSAELADVNRMVYGFTTGVGGGAGLTEIEILSTPEPCTLVGLGIACLAVMRRGRRSGGRE